MRISDWSSDVCSSDLIAVRLFADEQDRPLRFAARPDREVEHHARQHRHHNRHDVGRNARQVDDRDRAAVAGQAEDARHELAHGVADQHRSEEYTSELQSLMRISYAVFCLKKKKTKNNTYNLTQN